MKQVRSVSVLQLRNDALTPQPYRTNKDHLWEAMPNCQKTDLKLDGAKAIGPVTLKQGPGDGPFGAYQLQVAVTLSNGSMAYFEPKLTVVNFTPTGPASGNAPQAVGLK